jgi:hypothetical protein
MHSGKSQIQQPCKRWEICQPASPAEAVCFIAGHRRSRSLARRNSNSHDNSMSSEFLARRRRSGADSILAGRPRRRGVQRCRLYLLAVRGVERSTLKALQAGSRTMRRVCTSQLIVDDYGNHTFQECLFSRQEICRRKRTCARNWRVARVSDRLLRRDLLAQIGNVFTCESPSEMETSDRARQLSGRGCGRRRPGLATARYKQKLWDEIIFLLS